MMKLLCGVICIVSTAASGMEHEAEQSRCRDIIVLCHRLHTEITAGILQLPEHEHVEGDIEKIFSYYKKAEDRVLSVYHSAALIREFIDEMSMSNQNTSNARNAFLALKRDIEQYQKSLSEGCKALAHDQASLKEFFDTLKIPRSPELWIFEHKKNDE